MANRERQLKAANKKLVQELEKARQGVAAALWKDSLYLQQVEDAKQQVALALASVNHQVERAVASERVRFVEAEALRASAKQDFLDAARRIQVLHHEAVHRDRVIDSLTKQLTERAAEVGRLEAQLSSSQVKEVKKVRQRLHTKTQRVEELEKENAKLLRSVKILAALPSVRAALATSDRETVDQQTVDQQEAS